MEALLIIWFMQAVVCAGFVSTVAEAKGLRAGSWAVSGLLFGVIALIAVAGMPVRERRVGSAITDVESAKKTSEDSKANFDRKITMVLAPLVLAVLVWLFYTANN